MQSQESSERWHRLWCPLAAFEAMNRRPRASELKAENLRLYRHIADLQAVVDAAVVVDAELWRLDNPHVVDGSGMNALSQLNMALRILIEHKGG